MTFIYCALIGLAIWYTITTLIKLYFNYISERDKPRYWVVCYEGVGWEVYFGPKPEDIPPSFVQGPFNSKQEAEEHVL